jgi:N-acetylneuraminic acid mutarotase
MNSTGTIPPARGGHTASAIANQAYIFAGSEGSFMYNDLYVYDAPMDSWKLIIPSGDVPASRTNHAADIDSNGNLVIFGGYTPTGYDNSVYIYNPLAKEWEFPKVAGVPPTPRELSSLTIFKSIAFVFGGFHAGGVSSELYALDLEELIWE